MTTSSLGFVEYGDYGCCRGTRTSIKKTVLVWSWKGSSTTDKGGSSKMRLESFFVLL